MRYVGGKVRQAKVIADLIVERCSNDSSYWEPFIGGASVMSTVAPRLNQQQIFGSDICEDLILFWKAVQDGWVPPASVSQIEYDFLRTASPSPLRAWAGFAASYNGKWWGGYGPKAVGAGRDYLSESQRSTLRKAKGLVGVSLSCHSYAECDPKPGDVVYCDPPYEGVLDYGAATGFDHKSFWKMMESWARNGVRVLVSEYTAPPGWVVVHSFRRVETMNHGSQSSGERSEVIWEHNI